jgi:hypothetical protein
MLRARQWYGGWIVPTFGFALITRLLDEAKRLLPSFLLKNTTRSLKSSDF